MNDDERQRNRDRFPWFAEIVDQYRGSITAAFVYDTTTGEILVGKPPADWVFNGEEDADRHF